MPIKLGAIGASINTYTEEDIINARQGQGNLTSSTPKKGKDFCQNKLRELLQLENDEIEKTMPIRLMQVNIWKIDPTFVNLPSPPVSITVTDFQGLR